MTPCVEVPWHGITAGYAALLGILTGLVLVYVVARMTR